MTSIEDHWKNCHLNNDRLGKPSSFFLSSYQLYQYKQLFNIYSKYTDSTTILEVGVGEATAMIEMNKDNKILLAVDIAQEALNKVKHFAQTFLLNELDKIQKNSIDLIFCHLVVQHINNNMFEYHLKNLIPCLKDDGIYCIQYRENLHENIPSSVFETEKNCMIGEVLRKPNEVKELIELCGGKVINDYMALSGEHIEFGGKWAWRVVLIQKK